MRVYLPDIGSNIDGPIAHPGKRTPQCAAPETAALCTRLWRRPYVK